jgi:predicted Fe-Mo cluster-binding NifX family protein
MKIAVTAQGSGLSSLVDARFGRAKFFVVVDTETEEVMAVDNAQTLSARQGAGIQAGMNVVDLGATAVITGSVGPKAFDTLQAGGVDVFIGARGSVTDALSQFRNGDLKQAKGANVASHWI